MWRLCFIFIVSVALGCQKPPLAKAAAKSPKVASLVPAATDLIAGMGASDHLVAVSTFDTQRPEVKDLPRVGDYQQIDWEQIAALRPDVMVVFYSPQRMPAAVRQRAEELKIQLMNVRTERLDDVFAELINLGNVLHEPQKATATYKQLRDRLEATRKKTAGLAKVRTLVIHDKDGVSVVGRDTFIDDVLQIAGGENVLNMSGWTTIDAETMASLKPDAIIQLLPDASPQVLADAKRAREGRREIPAVASGRVYVMTDWWVLQPGTHVADLAEQMALRLHPAAASQPAGATQWGIDP